MTIGAIGNNSNPEKVQNNFDVEVCRALFLRNLVLGYGCKRVFPAGIEGARTTLTRWHPLTVYAVQPPLRWLNCVRMMSTRCASSEFQFRALREVATRERQVGIDAESLVERRRSTRKHTVACSLG